MKAKHFHLSPRNGDKTSTVKFDTENPSDEDYAKFKTTWRWRREQHAELIQSCEKIEQIKLPAALTDCSSYFISGLPTEGWIYCDTLCVEL